MPGFGALIIHGRWSDDVSRPPIGSDEGMIDQKMDSPDNSSFDIFCKMDLPLSAQIPRRAEQKVMQIIRHDKDVL